ncbi:DISARM system helicase DrmA [Bifidobacterium leontopitheci]|nr:DISARM system helicase DrmA [Bifidobacterium leontopitheci]
MPRKEYKLQTPLDSTSYAVRENLQNILERELCGPSEGDNEVMDISPKTKYILGRIAPRRIHVSEDERDDRSGLPYLDTVGDSDDEEDDDSEDVENGGDENQDEPQRRGLMIPSSMGLRFQVPDDVDAVTAHCSWGVYSSHKTGETDSKGKEIRNFYRTPMQYSATINLRALQEGQTAAIDVTPSDSGTVKLLVDVYNEPALRRRLVEVALCNDKETDRTIPVSEWLFQTKLEIDAGGQAVFLPVHDWLEDTSFEDETDVEEQRLHLQYRNKLEFAIGRTCSADWTVSPDHPRRAVTVRTTWLPVADIPQTSASADIPGTDLDMTKLATADAETVHKWLQPIADGYAAWLDEQQQIADRLPEHLRGTADEVIEEAWQVQRQLADGIDFLTHDEEALRCFHFMNKVMADQRVHTQIAAKRAGDASLTLAQAEQKVYEDTQFPHHWRVFQIAFILMQVHALSDPSLKVRSDPQWSMAKAQLLFFPTGGGKTEAYLGLAAYAFAARRRQGIIDSPDGKLNGNEGVTVLMRYTLRLLTSQQFQRASALVCAAELERRRNPEVWGDEPFRIGLWVGTNVTPKRVKEADAEIKKLNSSGANKNPSVLQIMNCPWCGSSLSGYPPQVNMTIGRVFVRCSDKTGQCPFADGGQVEEGIPVLTTDEEIYRLVPAFVIATVDKFARLARESAASSLFGYVGRKCDRHGYVPQFGADGSADYEECAVKDGHPKTKDGYPKALVHPTMRLRPPDLIIQDELHLITGSLGTTVGLFEAGIDVMSTWKDAQGHVIRPMIVASSATVRKATDQIKNLYARGTTMFPPQVLDASDTFFSKEVPVSAEHPGRRYIGISATGVRLSNTEIQAATTLLKGAQRMMDDPDGGNAADPYMTLVGYFSTTRELAGMARFMQDDISIRVRNHRIGSLLPPRRGTKGNMLNVGELTSRIASSDIVGTLNAMNISFDRRYESAEAWMRNNELQQHHKKPVYRPGELPFDAVLATSMLQVGVDVPRLGLMMIVGQPKNTAEYIQASSRVGRDAKRPGLVVTLGNWSRPRDLAHFEQFRAYHDSFYARVELLSVTPFSITSLNRGIEGLLVSAARVLQANVQDGLSPEHDAGQVDEQQPFLNSLIEKLEERIQYAACDDSRAQYAAELLNNRLTTWQSLAKTARGRGRTLVYERIPEGNDTLMPLMCSAEALGDQAQADTGGKFVVANSMREVQPEINILVSPLPEKLARVDKGGELPWQSQDSNDDNERKA